MHGIGALLLAGLLVVTSSTYVSAQIAGSTCCAGDPLRPGIGPPGESWERVVFLAFRSCGKLL
jgi:hypothetical protein